MKYPKVEQCVSPFDNYVNGHFIIKTDEYDMYQSYGSNIAMWNKVQQQWILDPIYWNKHSVNSKYRNKFMEMTTKDIMRRIQNNEILFTNLNE